MKTLVQLLIPSLLVCCIVAGCGSPFNVDTPVDSKPVDSTQHEYGKASMRIFYTTDWSSEAIMVTDSIPDNYVQVDTAFKTPYIRLRNSYVFIQPMMTDCNTRVEAIDVNLQNVVVGIDSLELKDSPLSGNGIALEATVFDRRGGKPRHVRYESGNKDVEAYLYTTKSVGRTIFCSIIIVIPCGDDKPYPGHDERSVVFANYTINY